MAEKKPQVRQGLDGKAIPKFCLLFLGNSEVGKTSIIMQYMNNCFRQDYYPTKDFIIYKKLYNFNPDPDEIDEYAYVEIIDTIAHNTGKVLEGYQEFFEETLIQERDLNKSNSKFPEILKKKIKYDYHTTGNENQRGLFSNDKVMGYVFVFDFHNEKSFTDLIYIASKIHKTEQSKKEDFTIKAFIGNKRDDILINEFGKKKVYEDDMVLENASKEKEYFNQLKTAFNEEFAKENLFYTSAKNNINIQKVKLKNLIQALSKILNKINQNESLWRKIAYEKVEQPKEGDKKNNEEEINEDRGFFSRIFCCNPRRNDIEAQTKKEEDDLIEEQEENMRFQEDDDDDDSQDHDKNYKFPLKKETPQENEAPDKPELKETPEEKGNEKPAASSFSCLIY